MMKDNRILVLQDSLTDIEKDLTRSLSEKNNEEIKYHFLRMYRLLGKVDKSLYQAGKNYSPIKVNQWFELRRQLQQKIGHAKAQLAYTLAGEGSYDLAENEWHAAIAFFPEEANYYLQYSHITLKNYGLALNKEIQENMQLINPHNIADVCTVLRRVRFAVKNSVSEQGINEKNGYFLTWLDLMEKEIEKRTDLIQAANQGKEEITLEAALAKLHELIGMKTVKQKLKEICDWVIFSQMRKEKGLKTDEMSLHMVFSGNPGTGKTTVARIVAKIYKSLKLLKKGHLVEAARSDLVAEYVGQTAIKTMNKIKEAEDGVLFIDEAYSLTRSTGNDFGMEAIDTLVKAMEDRRRNLVVILAGYPKEMEQFIQSNPGLYSRFKFHIFFPDYSIDDLMKIHTYLLEKKQYKITEEGAKIVRNIINSKIATAPENHGNGRLVRNIIEDEILNKAAYVVEQEKANHPVANLDVIDETIVTMVSTAMVSEEESNRPVKRPIGYRKNQ